MPSSGARPLPPPRFGIMPPGTAPRMLPPSINPIFGGHIAMRPRLPPPSRLPGRPNGMMPLFPSGPRQRGIIPIGPRMGPRGPLVRPWLQRMPMPQIPQIPQMPQMLHMRRKFASGNGNIKGKAINNIKKVNKLEVRTFAFFSIAAFVGIYRIA